MNGSPFSVGSEGKEKRSGKNPPRNILIDGLSFICIWIIGNSIFAQVDDQIV